MKIEHQKIFSQKVHFWVDKRTLRKLNQLSKKRAESKSLILREMLRKYLAKELNKFNKK